MSKIKVNLTSGNIFEKPLVTCFKGNSGNYIVFDNETNGSMGLPIICISKFNGNSCEKIVDPNEWASVKENLKSIISGNSLSYLNVPEQLSAADDFYTQLTLPVASFDLLKNVYKPEVIEQAVSVAPLAPVEMVTPVSPANQVSTPTVEPISQIMPEPSVITPEPINNTFQSVNNMQSNANMINPQPASAPVSSPIVEAAINPAMDVNMNPSSMMPQVNQEVQQAPLNNSNNVNDDIAVLRETFLQSCENVFDGLVKKLQNK